MFSNLSGTVILAVVAFMVVSAIAGSAMAGAGGWRALAARYPYPAVPPADEEHFRFSSVRTAGGVVGTASYGSIVTVGLSSSGVSLALSAPFRLFHPAILVPWSAVAECRDDDFIGRRFAMVTVAESGSFTVYGRAATVVAEYASAQGVPMKTS